MKLAYVSGQIVLSWNPQSEWGKRLAQAVFTPDMTHADLYELGMPTPDRARDYFNTRFSDSHSIFLRCDFKNVHVGDSKKVPNTETWVKLSKAKGIALSGQRPFRFDIPYRGKI